MIILLNNSSKYKQSDFSRLGLYLQMASVLSTVRQLLLLSKPSIPNKLSEVRPSTRRSHFSRVEDSNSGKISHHRAFYTIWSAMNHTLTWSIVQKSKLAHCTNSVLQANFPNPALIHIFRAAKNHTFTWTMSKSTWVLPKLIY